MTLAHLLAGLILAVGAAQAQVGDGSKQQLHVEVSNGWVTVRARNAVTGDILEELARNSDLVVVSEYDLAGRISVNVERQSLPDALGRILRNHSFALRHVPPASGPGRLKQAPRSTLWIMHEEAQRGSRRKQEQQPLPADGGSGMAAQQLALYDPDFRVRLQAVIELAEIGGDEVVAPLSLALADASEKVRAEAISALGEVGTEQAAAAIAQALNDQNSEVQQEAVWTLAEIGGSTSIQLLGETLGYPNKDLREAAIESLAEIGGDESARLLGIALQDEDASIREAAVDALGEIGGSAAAGLLQQALADGDPVVRSAAADVLEELSE